LMWLAGPGFLVASLLAMTGVWVCAELRFVRTGDSGMSTRAAC
jgi:hypothetical protein